jgi:hypothetical protein
MNKRIVLAWAASVLTALLLGIGLAGPGTQATFSDSIEVTHEIRTGRVAIVLTAVDGTLLADPSDSHHLTDTLSGTTVDLAHALTLRNDGTLDIGDITLTMSPTPGDIAPSMAKLVLEVSYSATDGSTATESHPLSYWLASPRTIGKDLGLTPGHDLDVKLHLTGDLPTPDQGQTTELTYRFTASAR